MSEDTATWKARAEAMQPIVAAAADLIFSERGGLYTVESHFGTRSVHPEKYERLERAVKAYERAAEIERRGG